LFEAAVEQVHSGPSVMSCVQTVPADRERC
jgi:hypothetical protein